jgi:hypothetical protein
MTQMVIHLEDFSHEKTKTHFKIENSDEFVLVNPYNSIIFKCYLYRKVKINHLSFVILIVL